MINDKKPEKVILDFIHVTNMPDVVAQIKEAGITCDLSSGEVGKDTEGILYITDDSGKAAEAKQKGLAVLIYLHDKNKNHNFNGFHYFIEGFEDVDQTYFKRIYQREKKIPWTIGETKRLTIREMTPEDADALYKLYEEKSVVKFMEDLPPNRTEEEIYIVDYIDKMYGVFGFGMWLVELKENAQVIGRIGFQNSEEADCVELGFMIVPKYQKQGYAFEACTAAVAYMTEEFPEVKIIAKCHKRNEAAIALCKKLGVEFRYAD